jgi:hypothetical protein
LERIAIRPSALEHARQFISEGAGRLMRPGLRVGGTFRSGRLVVCLLAQRREAYLSYHVYLSTLGNLHKQCLLGAALRASLPPAGLQHRYGTTHGHGGVWGWWWVNKTKCGSQCTPSAGCIEAICRRRVARFCNSHEASPKEGKYAGLWPWLGWATASLGDGPSYGILRALRALTLPRIECLLRVRPTWRKRHCA